MLTKLSCNNDPDSLNKLSKKNVSKGVKKKLIEKIFIFFYYFFYLNTFLSIVIILFVSYYYQGRRQAGNYYALGLSSSDILYKMSDKFNDDY